MARSVTVIFLVLVSAAGLYAIQSAPKVQVYTRNPPENGVANYLNCYVSQFHPPQIEIELLKNGKKMEKVEYSDLSFSRDWTFYQLAHAPFTPTPTDTYECRVTHITFKEPKTYKWDRDL